MSAWAGPYRVSLVDQAVDSSFRVGLDAGFMIDLHAAREKNDDGDELVELQVELARPNVSNAFCVLRPRPLLELDFSEGRRKWTFEARMRTEVIEWLCSQIEPSGDLELAVDVWSRCRGNGGRNRERLPLTLFASQWNKLLGGMGLSHRVSVSLEFPMSSRVEPQKFQKVASALERGQDELRAGRNPRKVMLAVRQALEALGDALGDTAAAKDASLSVRGRPVSERLLLVRKSISLLAGASSHAGDSEDVTPYELPEAQAALAMAVAVCSAHFTRIP